MRPAFALLVVAWTLTTPARSAAQTPSPDASGAFAQKSAADSARVGMESAFAHLDSAAQAGDAVGASEVFTADAVVSLGMLTDIRGWELRSAMAEFYRQFAVTAHKHFIAEMEVYGNTAYSRGGYIFISGPKGQPPKLERGRYAAVWHHTADGHWRIHRYLENVLSRTPQ